MMKEGILTAGSTVGPVIGGMKTKQRMTDWLLLHTLLHGGERENIQPLVRILDNLPCLGGGEEHLAMP